MPRTARYWVLGEEVETPGQVWFALHGYQQLGRRFVRRFQPLDDGTRRIVAPEALSRFYTDPAPGRHGPGSDVGGSWMTREDREHEIADYVRYLDRLADVVLGAPGDPQGAQGAQGGVEGPRVTVLGFSQGVATAARWSVLGRIRPHRLLLWGDFLPPDLDPEAAAAAWAGVDVVRVRGDADRVLSDPALLAAEEAWLARSGVVARTVRYPGGHEIDQPTLRALASSP